MDPSRGARVACQQQRVRLLGAEPLVLALPEHAALGRRRQRQVRERRAQVEPGSADDERESAAREDVVDRAVREPRYAPTDIVSVTGVMPTSRAGYGGAAVRIGIPA